MAKLIEKKTVAYTLELTQEEFEYIHALVGGTADYGVEKVGSEIYRAMGGYMVDSRFVARGGEIKRA